MQQKRTASLPIFNRGKRPRQALLSHPNNVDGVSSQEQQPLRDAHWNTPSNRVCKAPITGTSSRATFSTPGRQMSGNYGSHFQPNKENFRPPPRGSMNYKPRQNIPRPMDAGNRQLGYSGQATNSQPAMNRRLSGFTPHVPANKFQTNMLTHTFHRQTAPNSFFPQMDKMPPSFPAPPPPGRATVSRHHVSVKLEPGALQTPLRMSIQKTSHLPRVLTATARGVEHWSKFKAQIPMLFEVIGTLDSAVMAGPLGSREFRVQAEDGALRCLYWEIDTTLPHLVRGRAIRVMGSWDEKGHWLKCHSVREATQEEARVSQQLVKVSDATMRETVATMPEI